MPSAEEIIIIVWFFVLGGVIGSFLNVVVYRLPKRLSLIEPPSHCPNCKHGIRWYDNVPILGWILLRGKCRDCRQPISPRYPLVELTVALTFGILMAVEFALSAINLPPREVFKEGELISLVVSSSADRYLIVLYHLFLLCVLLCGALIEFDGNLAPTRMYFWTMLLGLIFPLQWTLLRPMKAWPGEPSLLAGGTEGVIGLIAGGTIGYIAWRLQGAKRGFPRRTAKSRGKGDRSMFSGERLPAKSVVSPKNGPVPGLYSSPRGFPLGIACVGVFLGWQAVLPIGIFAATVGFAAAALLRGKRAGWLIPASAWLWISTFFWILFWSPLVRWLNLP
jgi:prepilin signal peptidase PulO-like enzyme (type II secretory pathway)